MKIEQNKSRIRGLLPRLNRLGLVMVFWSGYLIANSAVYAHNGSETNPPSNTLHCVKWDECGNCIQTSKGNPIRMFSGESTENKQFLRLGGPLDMRVRITYGSRRNSHSQVGHNWAMSYIWHLYEVADTNKPFVIRNGDAERISFEPRGDGSYISLDPEYEILTIETNGNYVMTQRDHKVFIFDVEGRLTSIADGKGAELRFSYNAGGKYPVIGRSLYSNLSTNMVVARDYQLSQIDEYIGTNATGRGYAIFYDSNGHITNISDHVSRSVSITYSSEGDLLEMLDPEGNAYTCTYDDLGQLKTFVGLGCSDCVQVENFYNSSGSVTSQVQGVGAQGREMIVEYLSPEQSIATFVIKGPDGTILNIRREAQEFRIDGFGNTQLKKEAVDYGYGVTNTTEYWYDGSGQVTQRLDNGLAHIEISYDDRYNEVWKRQEVSAGVFLVRTNTYDDNNNLTEEKRWRTDQPTNFFITRYEYDAQNRRTKTKQVLDSGTELVEELEYNADGQVTRKIDPRGYTMAYEYDSFGFKSREYDPSNMVYQTQYQYDGVGSLTNRIDALGRETHFAYDNLGRMTREVNAMGYESRWTYEGPSLVEEEIGRDGATPGRVTQYGYNGLNKRTSIDRLDDVGATQRWLSMVYDSDGNILYETNALGFGTSYTYDNAGHRKTMLDPYGALTAYGYDAWGNITSVIDAVGMETWMYYDYLGRLTNLIEAVGTDVARTTGYRYNARGDRIEIIQPDGSSTYLSYNAVGRQTGVNGSRMYSTIFCYDGNGNQITVTDGRGNTTTNVYDAYNRLCGVIYSDGARNIYGYDLAGNRISVTDGNTNTTWFMYDDLNRLVSVSKPNASNIILQTKSYNPWGQMLGSSNIAGNVRNIYYDRLGRATNTVDMAGLSLIHGYDALDQRLVTYWPNGSSLSNSYYNARLTAVVNRAKHKTTYSYDIMGRCVTAVDSLGATNSIYYDALGRRSVQSNAIAEVTTYTMDSFDQVTSITFSNGKSEFRQYSDYGEVTNHYGAGQYPMSYQYDNAGNVINMRDGRGSVTSWSFDKRNRLERKIQDDGSYYEYFYDGNGNLTRQRDAKGTDTIYIYSAQNRLTRIDYTEAPDVSFTYDDLGRRTSMDDGQSTNTWIYDASGRVLTNTQGLVGGVVSYTYNNEGRRTSMVVNGDLAGYGYDDAGRLVSVSNEVGLFTYTWQPGADIVQSVRYPSGASVTNAYDNLRRLTFKGNLNSTGTVISSYGYAYDPVGLRTNQTKADGSGCIYGYDDTYQLTDAKGYLFGGGTDTNYAYQYGYDQIGNYTQIVNQGETEIYKPNSLNQYTNTTTRPLLSYDLNGNLMDDSVQIYKWDQGNRLVMASNAGGHVEFEYNGMGWKVEQREYANGIQIKATRYLYDGSLPIVELDESNQVIRSITRGIDMSRTISEAGGAGGLLALRVHDQEDTNNYYYMFDGNGNVVDLITEEDIVVAHYEYGPFGVTRLASGPMAGQPYRFSSKESVDFAGLYYYGYRFYNPGLGRWINRDPIGEYGGLNIYASTCNNPIGFVDIFGLKRFDCKTKKWHGHVYVGAIAAGSVTYDYEREDCKCCKSDGTVGEYWKETASGALTISAGAGIDIDIGDLDWSWYGADFHLDLAFHFSISTVGVSFPFTQVMEEDECNGIKAVPGHICWNPSLNLGVESIGVGNDNLGLFAKAFGSFQGHYCIDVDESGVTLGPISASFTAVVELYFMVANHRFNLLNPPPVIYP